MEKKIPQRKIKDPNSMITSEDIDTVTDMKQAQDLLAYFGGAIIEADLQLDKAKGDALADGRFMDADKFARLNGYRRVMGYLHQKTIFKIRELKAEQEGEGARRPFTSHFMDCARAVLTKDQFDIIYQAALTRKSLEAEMINVQP